jgi:hypothetical protein
LIGPPRENEESALRGADDAFELAERRALKNEVALADIIPRKLDIERECMLVDATRGREGAFKD